EDIPARRGRNPHLPTLGRGPSRWIAPRMGCAPTPLREACRVKKTVSEKKRSLKRDDLSSLDAHHRDGKLLTPPLMRMPAPTHLYSWQNERLPEVLWAILLSGGLPREEYMPLFCDIAKAGMQFRGRPKASLTHTALGN